MSPVSLDSELADKLADLAERNELPARRMPSGAGHDAQTMQSFCPSGLIFVPSPGRHKPCSRRTQRLVGYREGGEPHAAGVARLVRLTCLLVSAGFCNFRSFNAARARLGFSKVKHIVPGGRAATSVANRQSYPFFNGVPWLIDCRTKGPYCLEVCRDGRPRMPFSRCYKVVRFPMRRCSSRKGLSRWRNGICCSRHSAS